ncbi:MFS transporter [Paenibacillus hexagrammi]|uniref:MFS transporter n=1 Tax=Paenibacillus hexagrammi TaxID=2908839 RepID=A0ABY3SJV5_9BACL|nr:MFS transporter [Paenibacillus sp. YPD9-1]UJF34127.1 MFS transporter [Paenibacillus sp. YPD9-1]
MSNDYAKITGMPVETNRWIVLANVSLGTFMATLDGSIANVALPTMAGELQAPIHLVQWVLTAYLLAICATLPIMGKISDLIGRSRVYNYGFIVFAAGSALCGMSHSLGFLIISRVIQAIGASCLMSNSQAIVADVFSQGARGRALGIVGMVVSLGSLTGPGVGGILVDRFGWPTIFWINIPIGIIAFIAGRFCLPKDHVQSGRKPFDFAGSFLFIVGMLLLLYTISNANEWGWTSLYVLGGLLVSVFILVWFYRWEHKVEHPMLDFSLYRIRAFRVGNMTALLSFVAMFFVNVMMPFYMENVLGLSPEHTGYIMMMYPLTMAVIAPCSGWLSDKFGSNMLTTIGLVINAVGFGLLHTLTTQESPWIVGLHLALFGLGTGLFQSPNNSSVMGSAPKHKLGTAGGLNALVRNIGMVLGISLSVSLYSTRLHRLGVVQEMTRLSWSRRFILCSGWLSPSVSWL